MWKQIILSAFILPACHHRLYIHTERDVFTIIQVKNGQFIRNGQPYYYIGANFWYGAILASEGTGGNRERLHRELDSLKAIAWTTCALSRIGRKARPSPPKWNLPCKKLRAL